MRSHAVITLVAVGAFLTLPVPAWYQYRWIERVSVAERERLDSQLSSALNGFARDFDREIAGAETSVGALGPTAPHTLLRLGDYRTSQPQLVKAVLFAELTEPKELQLLRFAAELAPPESISWPPEWSSLRTKLLADSNRIPSSPVNWRIFAEVPALVLPIGNELSAMKAGPFRRQFPHGYVIVILDSFYLYQQLLPSLTQRYFRDVVQGTYHIQVRVQSNDNRVIYDSAPGQSFPAASLKSVTLFSGSSSNGGVFPYVRSEQLVSADGPWQLAVNGERSRAAALIENFRAVSLVMSSVSFLVLVAALVTLFVAARRAHGLAQAQWEFVSAVTHELRTPVTALRSIAENMSDGVVSPGRISRYGQLIVLQVERLSQMIEDVLEFGRSRRTDGTDANGTANVTAVLDEALAAYASTLERQGFRVARDIPGGLPPAQCSAPALRRSLENLIGNAIKYGAAGRWIGIGVRDGGKGEIIISIEDKGCGIETDERKRVFEPFFRGRGARAGQVPGTGLGLTVVKKCIESLGGRITVESEPGLWTRFDVFVPIANRYETTYSHR